MRTLIRSGYVQHRKAKRITVNIRTLARRELPVCVQYPPRTLVPSVRVLK